MQHLDDDTPDKVAALVDKLVYSGNRELGEAEIKQRIATHLRSRIELRYDNDVIPVERVADLLYGVWAHKHREKTDMMMPGLVVVDDDGGSKNVA